jgi:DHA1 family multidrug resistance protein-like MFS transporter
MIACYGTFVATFGSAVFAPGSKQASEEFGVGEEVGLLGTSLFVGVPNRHVLEIGLKRC